MHLPIFRFLRKVSKPRSDVNPRFRFFPHARNPNLSALGPLTCRLSTRSVIHFRGRDTAKFLQGLLTNDTRKIVAGDNTISSSLTILNIPTCTHKPIYAAMLTPQGRVLYDLFLYKMPSGKMTLDRTGSGPGPDNGVDEGAIYADVDSGTLDEALDCFKKYRVRSKVEIDNLAEEYCCWQRFGGALSKNDPENQEPDADALGGGAGVDRSGSSSAHGNNIGWQWFNDPRLDCLGFRGIFPSDAIPPLVEADKEVKEEHYLLWRIERGVAEGSVEIPKGEAIPLEYNFVGLNAISFDKGCYVGQELIAQTHHRGVIRKRLLPVRFTDDNGQEVEQEVSPHSEVVNGISGKKVGVVTTALGGRGMGLFKLDSVFKESACLTIKDKTDVKVRAIIPDWWPREWFHEQKQAAA